MFVGRLGSFLIMSEINIREFNPLEDAEAIYNIAKDAWLPIYDQRKGELDSDIFYSLYLDGPIHKSRSSMKRGWRRRGCRFYNLGKN